LDDVGVRRGEGIRPDVVVIMLGTNDAKPQNWRHQEEFAADYVAMIDVFAALPSRPAIWVCHPVPTFGAYGARDPVLRNDVIPMIDRAAKIRRVPAIDLYAALRGRVDLFPNGIHPNAEGARLIAETVRRAIRTPRPRVAPGLVAGYRKTAWWCVAPGGGSAR
jgi:acyl-CoA thioesterase-1